jgi:hypothetical protein
VAVCKELRSLTIYVEHDMTLIGSEELQQFGNSCTQIEVLNLKGRYLYSALNLPSFLPSFLGVRIFTISQSCNTVPPANRQDWVRLRGIRGDYLLNDLSWTKKVSMLPNLEEVKIRSDMICDENIINFCNLSKDKPICKTLEVFDSL